MHNLKSKSTTSPTSACTVTSLWLLPVSPPHTLKKTSSTISTIQKFWVRPSQMLELGIPSQLPPSPSSSSATYGKRKQSEDPDNMDENEIKHQITNDNSQQPTWTWALLQLFISFITLLMPVKMYSTFKMSSIFHIMWDMILMMWHSSPPQLLCLPLTITFTHQLFLLPLQTSLSTWTQPLRIQLLIH